MEKLPLHSCLCLDAPRILAFRSAPFLDRKIKGRREARIPYLEADRFTCFADGYPRPSVFIQLNGKNLTVVNDIKRHGNTVSNISTSWIATSRETQEFCCHAYSKEGRAKKECITAFVVEGILLYIGTNKACLLRSVAVPSISFFGVENVKHGCLVEMKAMLQCKAAKTSLPISVTIFNPRNEVVANSSQESRSKAVYNLTSDSEKGTYTCNVSIVTASNYTVTKKHAVCTGM